MLISPRRFGKTSLINKVLNETSRPKIFLDMQLVTNTEDFAAQLLKRVYRIYTFEKLKNYVKNFRIIPGIIINPVTGDVEVTFHPSASSHILLEDVLNLIEKACSSKNRPIVVLDEFQEIYNIGKNLNKYLRSTIQHHKNINYIFSGSQESLMRSIFENKKSPFYHFGEVMLLDKIPEDEFKCYLSSGLRRVTEKHIEISTEILNITRAHPYYTQQLAYTVWELLNCNSGRTNIVGNAVKEVVKHHDMDYERLWLTFNRTDMKTLIGMASSGLAPLSAEFSIKFFTGATSTVYSSIKRLLLPGIVIKTESGYEIDDPFFMKWIIDKREASLD